MSRKRIHSEANLRVLIRKDSFQIPTKDPNSVSHRHVKCKSKLVLWVFKILLLFFFKHFLPLDCKSFRSHRTWICFWLCIFRLGLTQTFLEVEKKHIFVDRCVQFWKLRVNLPEGLRLKKKLWRGQIFSGKGCEAESRMVLSMSFCMQRKSGSLRKRGASVFREAYQRRTSNTYSFIFCRKWKA